MRWVAPLACIACLFGQSVLAQDVDPDLTALICGQEAGDQCSAVAEHDAGAAGTIVEVGYDASALPDDLAGWGCRFDPLGFEGGRAYWLVGPSGEAEQILRLCNDGYGAAQVGEDAVTIDDNRVIHEQYGGSAWRWVERRVLNLLDPRAMVESRSCSAYGGSALWAAADDWQTNRTWVAWVRPQTDSDLGGPWCPDLDIGSPSPRAPEGFQLGLAINGYRAGTGDLAEAAAEAIVCGAGVGKADRPTAAPAQRAILRLVALTDGAGTALHLVAEVDTDRVPDGTVLRLAWTESAHTAVEARLFGHETPAISSIDIALTAASGRRAGPWRIERLGAGRIVASHAPFAEDYENRLIGVTAGLVDPDEEVIAGLVPWSDGLPVMTPAIAWRSFFGADEGATEAFAIATCSSGPGDLPWPAPRGFPQPIF